MFGCLIVFAGVVLYKVTYHLAKNGKKEGSNDGRVQFEALNAAESEDSEEEKEVWFENVPQKLSRYVSDKYTYEMKSIDIQMDMPSDGVSLEDDTESPMRHRVIT